MTNLGMSNGEFNAMLVQLDELPGRCVNPMCLQQVSYRTTTRGRQSLFCSTRCRKDTWRMRIKLARWLQQVEESADLIDRPASMASLNAAAARLRWLLVRYPLVEDSGTKPSTDDEHMPLAVAMARLGWGFTPEILDEAARYDARMRVRRLNRRTKVKPVSPTDVELANQRRHAILWQQLARRLSSREETPNPFEPTPVSAQ